MGGEWGEGGGACGKPWREQVALPRRQLESVPARIHRSHDRDPTPSSSSGPPRAANTRRCLTDLGSQHEPRQRSVFRDLRLHVPDDKQAKYRVGPKVTLEQNQIDDCASGPRQAAMTFQSPASSVAYGNVTRVTSGYTLSGTYGATARQASQSHSTVSAPTACRRGAATSRPEGLGSAERRDRDLRFALPHQAHQPRRVRRQRTAPCPRRPSSSRRRSRSSRTHPNGRHHSRLPVTRGPDDFSLGRRWHGGEYEVFPGIKLTKTYTSTRPDPKPTGASTRSRVRLPPQMAVLL